MIITTTDTIPNKEVSEILGIARGSTVRARNIGRDIFAGLKNIIGGEISVCKMTMEEKWKNTRQIKKKSLLQKTA
jgi:uncharacterized protein YbjQ (UPF0145 family)